MHLSVFFQKSVLVKKIIIPLPPRPFFHPSRRHCIYSIPESLPPFDVPSCPAYPTRIHLPSPYLSSWYLYLSSSPSYFHISRNCANFASQGQDSIARCHMPPQTTISAVLHICCCCPCHPSYLPPPFMVYHLPIDVVSIVPHL